MNWLLETTTWFGRDKAAEHFYVNLFTDTHRSRSSRRATCARSGYGAARCEGMQS